MTWARAYVVIIVSACALVITAYVPPVLTDTFVTAVAQIRKNAAKTDTSAVSTPNTVTPYPEATSEPKSN